MKKLLSILLLFVSLAVSAADDVIVLKNSTRIDAKIEEINDLQVKYKKSTNVDGPSFIVNLTEVSIIILANGEVMSYADYQAPQQNGSKAKTSVRQKKDSTSTKPSWLTFNPTPSDKRTYGLSIGYVSRKVCYVDYDHEPCSWVDDDDRIPTFQLGWIAQPEFKYGIGIKTGLNFEFGHCHTGSGEYELRAIDLGLSVPLQVSYRYELLKNLSFMLYTGPVFAFGYYLSITEGAYPYSYGTNLYKKGYLFDSKYDGFNCLWGIGAAVQWCGLRLTMGGDFGMIHRGGSYNYVHINEPFYITLGYMFNNKK